MKQPRVILKRQDRINYITRGVTDYFHTTREDIAHFHRNPELFDRKRILIKLLKDYGDVEMKEIAHELGISYPAGNYCYRSITEDLPCHRFKELRQTYNEVIKHLELQ